MANIKSIPIRLALKDASLMNEPESATLSQRFLPLAAAVNAAYRQRFGGNLSGNSGSSVGGNSGGNFLSGASQHHAANLHGSNQVTHQPAESNTAILGANDPIALIAAIADFLAVADQLDTQYGADAGLPLADADDAADEALRAATELETWLDRFELSSYRPVLSAIMLGVGLWAMRHGLPIATPEPIVNALAARSNEATSKQETAAAYAMMQGFITHLAPALEADLERSNPERPWRLLNLNFAITAIRTGDAALIRFAFDKLNQHLPDERMGFYEEAYAVASQPGFPLETRALIEAEHAKSTRLH